MLVLTRKEGQRIWIGDDICVVMQEWRGSSTGMRVGIEAPPHVNVVREELLLEHDPRRQRTLRRLAGDEE